MTEGITQATNTVNYHWQAVPQPEPAHGKCPSCGFCGCCGRRDFAPIAPYIPIYPYTPYYPWTVWSGTTSIGTNTAYQFSGGNGAIGIS